MSGKMLIANRMKIVGATKIQAIALSESPFTFFAITSGVARAARSITVSAIAFT
jgi:hypothetical protein